MLRNLPENLKGSVAFPITISLDKGICVELHYNGSMFRKGIVYANPAATLTYMWWQPTTRFRSGEIPVCTTLEHGVPKERLSGLTIEPVGFFDQFVKYVPLSIKRSFGWTYTRRSRASKLPRKDRSDIGVRKGPRKIRADQGNKHTLLRQSRSDKGVVRKKGPPHEISDPPWTPPHNVHEASH